MFIEGDLDPTFLTEVPPGGENAAFITGGVGVKGNRVLLNSTYNQILQINPDADPDLWFFYNGTPAKKQPLLPGPAGSDTFADAPEIGLDQKSVPTLNLPLGVEVGEPNTLDTDDWTLLHTAWWKYTATESGSVVASTVLTVDQGNGTDTILAVYSGESLDTLSIVGDPGLNPDDDSGDNLTSIVTFTAVAGTTYYFQVGSWGDDEMYYRLSLRRDIGIPDEPSTYTQVRLDADRAMYFRLDSDTLWAYVESGTPMAHTTEGDQNSGRAKQIEGVLSSGSFGTRWLSATAWMKTETQGYALIWAQDGTSVYKVFLQPFTLDGVEITALGTRVQLGSTNTWLPGDAFGYDDTHFVAMVREVNHPPEMPTQLPYVARIRLYNYDGTLVEESADLGPLTVSGSTATSAAEATACIGPDKTLYLIQYNSSVADDTATLFLSKAVWNGSDWVVTPGTVLGVDQPNRIGFSSINILSNGNLLVDYTTGVLVTPGGWVNYTRHIATFSPIDLSLVEEVLWGGDETNPLNWSNSGGGLWVAITENYVVAGYLDSNPYPYELRTRIFQYAPIWNLKAHHGKRVFKFTANGETEASTIQTISPGDEVTIVDHLPNLPPSGGSEQAGVGVFGSDLDEAQWSDGLDTTYARVRSFTTTGTDYATVAFPTVEVDDPTKILSATVSVRISGPSDTATKAFFRIAKTDGTGLVGDSDPALVPSGALPAADAPITIEDIPLDYGDDIGEVLVQSGLAIYMWPSGGAKDLKIYEVWVTVEIAGDLAPTQITFKGPSTPEQGDSAKHQGRFAVDETTRNMSCALQVAPRRSTIWVQPEAQFYKMAPGADPIGAGHTTFPALMALADSQWKEINIFDSVPLDVTHYSITAKMFADSSLTTPLPADTEVYLDCIFVPESGYDLRDGVQPYLDGDQSFGIWEGEIENSTSIYGTKPVDDLSKMILLDYDLPAYDARTSTPVGPVDPVDDTPPPLDTPDDDTPPSDEPDLP